jgi:Tol biopolymer transport system component
MNIDGSNPSQITGSNMGVIWHPRFSPAGNQVLFQCSKPEKKDFDLYVIDRNGNNLKQLTTNTSFDGEPYWATDGNIYFTSDRGGNDSNYQIWRFRYGASSRINMPTEKKLTEAPNDTFMPSAYHTVQSGETITDIARRYGVTVKDIVQWNSLMTMTIKSGMKLKVSAQ